ncbi:MAG TPA: protein kinase, partial [Chloroflexota bacterium]|nr:protein kinase [Chloroflexota bacterium]
MSGDQPADTMIGRTLGNGRYRLVGLLGRGGMGSVYEAEHLGLRRRVALKVLDPALTNQKDFVDRFHREIETIAHLEHPNILPVYDSGEEDGLLYLVMLLVRDGTLKDRLTHDTAPWEPTRVLQLAQQVLSALDAAHSQGIIHRDIKPDNVLLHGQRAYLADFGIAKLMQGDPGLTAIGTFVGTPDYASPEQVLALPLDGRSDLYAFGVVLYELLTGRVPYRGETPMGVALQHVQGPVPAPSTINPELPQPIADVLVKSLSRERDDRYATGPEMAAALAAAVYQTGGVPHVMGVLDPPRPYVHPTPDQRREPTVIDAEAAARERERLEAEAREKERLEAEAREKERLAFEERERERLAAEAREREQARQRAEAAAAAAAAAAREQARREAEATERARQQAEADERARKEAEAAEHAQQEANAAEQARKEAEAAERARKQAEAAERERQRRAAAAAVAAGTAER